MASRKGERIDFRQVADAALASLESLLFEWLPHGRRDGHEFKATNPTRSDSREGSFSININTGAWADFATGDKGGDAISLYAYLQGIKQLDAAKQLAAKLGVTPGGDGGKQNDAPARKAPDGGEPAVTPSGVERKPKGEWDPIVPAPAHATALPKAHINRRFPEAVWEYRDREGKLLGAVYRFKTSDGGKEILPCVWAKHRATGAQEWRWQAFPDPRPLYGLQHLQADGPVLVVEGEKCADAARSMVAKSWSVVTWPSGSKAVGKADWSPLRGRKVVIWPDCDAQLDRAGELLPEARQPGIRAAEEIAAILRDLECEIRIVKIPAPGAKPGGWDVADAIAEGWTAANVREYILGQNLRHAAFSVVEGSKTDNQAAPDDDWKRELARDDRGKLIAGVPNAFLMLTHRQEWRDVLAFDEFAQRPVKRMPPPFERGVAGDWDAMDDSFTAFWLATRAGMPKMSSAQAAEAAEMAARASPFDPVRGYLEQLEWDGRARLDNWLADFFGAPNTRYTQLVGRFWLIGMVRRAFEPGCKFDYMPILEGPQGRGKSTAMAILAGPEHFGNTDFVMGDKDSMALMQGKWLYEIAELDSFNKADTTRVKSFVTRQTDEFRPAYGRRILKIPRRVVLVGTTNQYEYFKDSTGNRRFWPVKVVDQINLDGLHDARAQLFAEAVQRFRDGERCYPTREEQDEHFTPEQDAREISDAWDDAIHRWLNTPHEIDGLPNNVSSFDILRKALQLDPGKITKEMSTRVGISMRKLGWLKVERRLQTPRFVYERPKKSAHDTSGTSLGNGEDTAGVPF